MATDLMFLPVADALRDALCAAITAHHSNPPAHCRLMYGAEVAFDLGQNEDLCCEGLAWVRIGDAQPGWPEPDSTPLTCDIPVWRMELEMGIVRCAPTGDEDAGPTAAEHELVAVHLAEDFAVMRRALCTFLPGREVIVSGYSVAGPAGGCVGGAINLLVQVISCDECAEEA